LYGPIREKQSIYFTCEVSIGTEVDEKNNAVKFYPTIESQVAFFLFNHSPAYITILTDAIDNNVLHKKMTKFLGAFADRTDMIQWRTAEIPVSWLELKEFQ